VACIAFAATLLQSFTTWTFSTHPLKTQVALLVSLVNGVSSTLYAAKCLGHVTIVASGMPGEHMMPLRYLQWMFTTGCLIRVLACLSPAGPRSRAVLRNTTLADLAMLFFGFLERMLPWPRNALAFGAASLCFVVTMRGQYTLFRYGAITLSTESDKVALASLQRMTTFTWLLFPVARAACLAGLLGTNGEEVVFSMCDLISKFGYSTFLMVGTFSMANSG
jgi:bacteriorhodopsin